MVCCLLVQLVMLVGWSAPWLPCVFLGLWLFVGVVGWLVGCLVWLVGAALLHGWLFEVGWLVVFSGVCLVVGWSGCMVARQG